MPYWDTKKKQRNHTKNLPRKDLRVRQNETSRDSKVNPKTFWNYVNSKTKTRDKIGDLTVVKDNMTM